MTINEKTVFANQINYERLFFPHSMEVITDNVSMTDSSQYVPTEKLLARMQRGEIVPSSASTFFESDVDSSTNDINIPVDIGLRPNFDLADATNVLNAVQASLKATAEEEARVKAETENLSGSGTPDAQQACTQAPENSKVVI